MPQLLRPSVLAPALLGVAALACATPAGFAQAPATPATGLLARTSDLPSAPEPQQSSSAEPSSSSSTQQPTTQQPSAQQPAPPSLEDLGLQPQQTRADLDAQHRLDRRTHDLKVHQTLGLITLVPIAAACLSSGLAPADPRSSNNEVGRDIHVALGSLSVGMYGATAWYAIKAPRMPGQGPTKGGIKLHKYLVAIHAPGMVLTPILGAMAYNQAANGQHVTGIASAHGAVALITAAAYAASIVAVSWPIRLPGHHSDIAAASTTATTTAASPAETAQP